MAKPEIEGIAPFLGGERSAVIVTWHNGKPTASFTTAVKTVLCNGSLLSFVGFKSIATSIGVTIAGTSASGKHGTAMSLNAEGGAIWGRRGDGGIMERASRKGD